MAGQGKGQTIIGRASGAESNKILFAGQGQDGIRTALKPDLDKGKPLAGVKVPPDREGASETVLENGKLAVKMDSGLYAV